MISGRAGARLLLANVLIALGYAAVGGLTLAVARYTGLAAPMWPAAGIAFAVVYMRGARLAFGVAVGSFMLNAITLRMDGQLGWTLLAVPLAIGLGAALEAMVGATLVRRFLGTHLSLSRGGEVLAFLLLAGPLACVVNPTIGVLAQVASGLLAVDDAAIGWLTWWVGDSAGVVVFAPLALMLFPEQADIWRHRQWKVAVPSLIVAGILGAAFLQNTALEARQIDTERAALAASAARDVEETLARNEEVLRGEAAFFEADEQVSREEFAEFTEDALRRFPNMHALSWNTAVTASELPAFVEDAVVKEGMTGFTVTQRAADGSLEPVTPRPDYVVVTYIEPLADNTQAVGYDIKSDPVRAEAIVRATDTGQPAATAPVTLVQETGQQKGVLLLLPVYAEGNTPPNVSLRRANIEGFAVGIYRLGDLLVSAFDSPTWRDTTLRMFDVTDAADPVLLAEQVGTVEASAANTASVTMAVAGRTWRLDVTAAPDQLGGLPAVPTYLLAGLLIITLLEAFLLLVTGMERQARRQADASHYDASHDGLTDLLNRRAFMEHISEARLQSTTEGVSHVLMYLDLDDFKAINDRGGHEAGDRCLQEIAQRFAQCVRSGDIVARLGGDEFAVILEDCPLERGLAIARELVAAADSYRPFPEDPDFVIGVSVGVTTIDPTPPTTVDDLLHRADIACYEAKREGKGHVRVFIPGTSIVSG